MRVKVGDTWYEPEPGQAIMVEWTEDDRRVIQGSHRDNNRYAVFAKGDGRTQEEMKAWTRDGLAPDAP